MGRYFVYLDPPGFYYTSEPGAHFEWAAPQYTADARTRYKDVNPGVGVPDDLLFAVPASDRALRHHRNAVHPWLICTPRQTGSNWLKDGRLSAHVLRSGEEWFWAPEILGSVREWEPTKKPDGTSYPANLWQTIPAIPDGTIDLLGIDWTSMGSAAEFDFPAGMAVVGVAAVTPSGGGLMNLTPFISYDKPPGPDDVAVFGFGQYAIVFNSAGISLMQQAAGVWHMLGVWSYETPTAGVLIAPLLNQTVRTVMVLNVPPGNLSLFFGGQNGVTVEPVPIEGSEIVAQMVSAGSWWVAAAPGAHFSFQVQVVGYENVDTGVLRVPTVFPDFDLGALYKPALSPTIAAHALLHSSVGAALASPTVTSNSYSAVSDLGEEIILSLFTETFGEPWVSDGTHHAGYWRLEMVASTDRVGGYTCPAIRDWAIRFPVNLVLREHSLLVLDDTQFRSFHAETSYYEPDGKRVMVDLWDTGLRTVRDAGFDTREGYPIQVWEDTDDDGIEDTVRVTGWVHKPNLEEHFTETEDRGLVAYYQLDAKGLLSRGNCDWYLLPQMVDPSGGGFIEHTFAVRESILAMGLDVSDPNQWAVAVDSMAGTARSQLPGTWGNRNYNTQIAKDNAYAPKFDENKLDYAARIATQWAGWVLYEELSGLIWYHPDLCFELALGVNYYISFPVYSNEADANADGYARQKYLALPSQTVTPVMSNSVRIQGPEDSDVIPVIASDPLGWTNGAYENFIGEPKPKTLTLEMAQSQQAAEVLGAVALVQLGQRVVDWSFEVPLASWDMVTADQCEIGYVAEVQGKGDRLITHLEVELIQSRTNSELKSRFTSRRLSANGSAALPGVKPYPGRCVTILGP